MAENTVLPTDHFSTVLRSLQDNPGALQAESTIHTRDFYGNTASWILRSFRVDGQVWQFVQRSGAVGDNLREVFPPEVTAAMLRQQSALVSKSRTRAAQRALETRRERGDTIGNPEALRRARARRARKGGRRS